MGHAGPTDRSTNPTMKSNNGTTTLSMRSILVSLVVIGIAAAAAGAGVMAHFSDEETSTGNSVQAGTLDLYFGETSAALAVENAAPGDSGMTTFTLRNDGTIDGVLSFNVTNLINSENDQNEPEQLVDTTAGEFDGELGNYLYVTMWVDEDGDAEFNSTVDTLVIDNELINDVEDVELEATSELTAESQKALVVEWTVGQEGNHAGNDIQSDGVSFDINVLLSQDMTADA